MRVLNKTDFMSMPVGTLFSKYVDGNIEELCIKDISENQGRYMYTEVNTPVEGRRSKSFDEDIRRAMQTGESLEVTFEELCWNYAKDTDVFLVWEEKDIRKVMAKFSSVLSTSILMFLCTSCATDHPLKKLFVGVGVPTADRYTVPYQCNVCSAKTQS